jgi:phosphatidylinositol-3-phosphatase
VNWIKLRNALLLLSIPVISLQLNAQNVLPVPDHIVVLFLENHDYSQIIGSQEAPYINALATDSYTALFTHSYGIEHPSQPNYLDFYSGSNQGVTGDGLPANSPFSTDNLGYQLINAGLSFTTFSEDLPEVGFNGASSGSYARKHNPAANWMGTGQNQIPPTTNQPFSAFPFTDFNLLPTVCFVVPNQDNDMHNGTISAGDSWLNNNLNNYIQWSKDHNSLFILTFDEDNYNGDNHIVTLFTGKMVIGGEYADTVNHFNILRTIEDMYGLTYAGNAATASPVLNCWNPAIGIGKIRMDENLLQIFPNPSNGDFILNLDPSVINDFKFAEIFDVSGKRVFSEKLFENETQYEFHFNNLKSGIYLLRVIILDRIRIIKINIQNRN